MSQWQPTASIETLRQRALLITRIRRFFAERDVLEVETPVMSNRTVTDVHLHAFSTEFVSPLSPENKTLYLQTSPEYAMKRLLCAGSGAIYQITKSFRNEEAGRFHNPEFSMLEWYRPGFNHHQLMDEMDEFLQTILVCQPADRMTYQQAFLSHLDIDPLAADLKQLVNCCLEHGLDTFAESETDTDTLLQLLFCECVEPKIGQHKPAMVYNFPASQAALARVARAPDGHLVAQRFELFFNGTELANGYHELTDPEEQRRRFNNESRGRPVDERLLAAMASGLPDCSGVAMGADRLLMHMTGSPAIADVISFDWHRA